MVLLPVRREGRGMAVEMAVGGGHELPNKELTCKYGCFNASPTSIRRFGLNVRHFSIKSIAYRR